MRFYGAPTSCFGRYWYRSRVSADLACKTGADHAGDCCRRKAWPVAKAQINIERYHVQNMVSARLSDGLNEIFPQEADDIVIAGMGGEMIIQIISDAFWLKAERVHLILQPMTSAEQLRIFLAERGFAVLREQAVVEDGRAYSVLLVQYNPEKVCVDEFYPHIGKLTAESEDNRAYIYRRIINLEKRRGV